MSVQDSQDLARQMVMKAAGKLSNSNLESLDELAGNYLK